MPPPPARRRRRPLPGAAAPLLLLLLLIVALTLGPAAAGSKGMSEEGDPDCDKATGWEALENPVEEDGCVWDVLTAIWEFGDDMVFKAQTLWRDAAAAVGGLLAAPEAEPAAAGCMEGWAGADCDECAPGYSGELCDQKEL